MISKVAESITKSLIRKNQINNDDFELYHYGVFIIISESVLLSFCAIFGLMFGIIVESLIFYITFILVRRFAGGVHAKTELVCLALTLSTFLLCIIFIKILRQLQILDWIIGIQAICSLIMVVCSPATTPQKQLSIKEQKTFKLFTFLITVVFLNVNIVFYKTEFLLIVIIPIAIAVIFETVLVVLGKMFNHRLANT